MAFPTGWGRKCEITIPAAKIIGNNTDFMVVLKTANFPLEAIDGGVNSALNGGGDVRFSLDSSGANQLAIDIRRFVTGGTPDIELVVKIPSLNTGADRSVWLWYKKAGEIQPLATDPYGSQAANSKAMRVFALDETPTGIANEFRDRTSAAAHGTAYNTGDLASVADGVDFLSSNNNVQGNIQSSPVGTIPSGAVVVDFMPRDIGKADQFITKSRTSGGNDRLYMTIRNYQLRMRLGGGTDLNLGGLSNNVRCAAAIRWTGGGGTAHKDGANFGSSYSYSDTPGSSTSNLYLGTYDGTLTSGVIVPFDGVIYGFWLFNQDLGQDYLNTFTGMLADAAAFASAGTPEAVGGGGINYTAELSTNILSVSANAFNITALANYVAELSTPAISVTANLLNYTANSDYIIDLDQGQISATSLDFGLYIDHRIDLSTASLYVAGLNITIDTIIDYTAHLGSNTVNVIANDFTAQFYIDTDLTLSASVIGIGTNSLDVAAYVNYLVELSSNIVTYSADSIYISTGYRVELGSAAIDLIAPQLSIDAQIDYICQLSLDTIGIVTEDLNVVGLIDYLAQLNLSTIVIDNKTIDVRALQNYSAEFNTPAIYYMANDINLDTAINISFAPVQVTIQAMALDVIGVIIASISPKERTIYMQERRSTIKMKAAKRCVYR